MADTVLFEAEYDVYDPDENSVFQNPLLLFLGVLSFIFLDAPRFLWVNKFLNPRSYVWLLRARLHYLLIKKRGNYYCIISYIDNSALVSSLGFLGREIPLIVIQNGVRNNWSIGPGLASSELKYCFDDFYCFGKQTMDLLLENGHNVKNFHLCGSVLGGSFYSKNIGDKREVDHDLCVISQWSSMIELGESNWDDIWVHQSPAYLKFMDLISGYSKEYDVSIVVALRTTTQDERDFYKKYLISERVKFVSNDKATQSSYRATMSAKVSLSVNSALAFESFGAGLKTLFINPDRCKWIDVIPSNEKRIWYYYDDNQKSFNECVNNLLEVSLERYLEITEKDRRYIMNYDFQKPAHIHLMEKLKILEGTNCGKS